MTRPKTISDEELLAVARKLFRTHGHAVSTRQIAEGAGISEAILYQRFGNKDHLFFAAMAPGAPDIEEVLGPDVPESGARGYLSATAVRMAAYFGEVIPVALRIITHPSFTRESLSHAQTVPEKLREGLVVRLKWFEGERQLRKASSDALARLLINLAHDWALSQVMSHRPVARRGADRTAELTEMVDLIWKGAAPARR
jgi:AcrR family transcriptional regulator